MHRLILIWCSFGAVYASPIKQSTWPLVQLPELKLPDSAPTYLAEVKQIFTESYEGYRKYAWGHDDVKPVTQGFKDTRNGWGATIADSLGTLYIMGLTDWFDEAVKFASTINFEESKSGSVVSVFETTIRYLGGFLSAYQLSEEKHPILLQKATELADKLAYAWEDGKPLPAASVKFYMNRGGASFSSNIAEAGSLSMEWSTLSAYTGNETYMKLGAGAALAIAKNTGALPGLVSQYVGTAGVTSGEYITWGAASDSYFEYLLKYPRLMDSAEPIFLETWKLAVDSSIKHLLKRSVPGNWSFLADWNSGRVSLISSHLACFDGGNWILGGKLLKNETIVQYGLDLVDGCWQTYAATATGIGPENWAFDTEHQKYFGGLDPSHQAFQNKSGFYIRDSRYILRPEVLESNFYAWRATGNIKYYNNAVCAIKSFRQHLALSNHMGYTGIDHVNKLDSKKGDDTESFWFAEVLKYLYLTFDNPNHISIDEWVFNTEAHPLRPWHTTTRPSPSQPSPLPSKYPIVPDPDPPFDAPEDWLPAPPAHDGNTPPLPPPLHRPTGIVHGTPSSRPQIWHLSSRWWNAMKSALYQAMFLVFQ